MALADKPPAHKPRGSCGLGDKLGLTADEITLVESWLGHYSDQAVSDRLAEDDYRVSAQVIGRHRLGKCSCTR